MAVSYILLGQVSKRTQDRFDHFEKSKKCFHVEAVVPGWSCDDGCNGQRRQSSMVSYYSPWGGIRLALFYQHSLSDSCFQFTPIYTMWAFFFFFFSFFFLPPFLYFK